MARTLLDRLRFLLRGLREPGPTRESERRALAAFERELGRKAERPERRTNRGSA